jgi:hypothetical protein
MGYRAIVARGMMRCGRGTEGKSEDGGIYFVGAMLKVNFYNVEAVG